MIASWEVLEQWQGRETVPLSEVARAVDMPRGTRDFAVRTGAIRPCAGGGRGRAHHLAWDEVVLIVTAAALAAAAGVAVTVIIRALRASGATVNGSAVVIKAGAR
jgi:hypothetical protein